MKIKKIIPKLITILVIAAIAVAVVYANRTEEDAQEDKLADIEFTVVGADEQPQALVEIISEKLSSEFQLSYTAGDEMYIAVGYGEQPSAGYSISVNALYETQESIVVDTTLIGPGSAENVTNTKTTPYIVIKIQNIDQNIEGKVIEFK